MNPDVLKAAGIEYESGVRRFMGDEKLYQQVLGMFLEDTIGERIQDAFEGKDYAALFSCVHELKGVSGNLDMPRLYRLSSTLTELLRSGNYVEEKIIPATLAVMEEYAAIRSAIDAAR